MSGYQTRLYAGMLRLFRAYPQNGIVDGASWVPITASGGTVSSAPALTAGDVITLYVLPVSIVRERMTLPAVGIYTANWWGLPPDTTLRIAAGVVLVNVADATLAFLVDGQPDLSQGFPVFPLAPCAVPEGFSTVTQAGYRSPLWVLGLGA